MKQASKFSSKRISSWVMTSLIVIPLAACDSDNDDKVESAFTLQLLHLADMDGSNATALDNAGNLASNVLSLTAQYPDNTLFLSSGDNYIPGSRYEAAADESMANVSGIGVPGVGRADIAMLNAMGLQASAVGNHDLDGGIEEFVSIINKETATGDYHTDYAGAQFPYLSSNMVFANDANSAPLVVDSGQYANTIANSLTSSTVIEVDGERIGIVGATTPTNDDITSTDDATVLPESDSTTELASIIQAQVDALTATGINKVILLAHMQNIKYEKQLAGLLNDVDIIVAGGSNTLLADDNDRLWDGDTAVDTYPLLYKSADGNNDVAIVNVDGDYKYLGRLVVGFNEEGDLQANTINASESGAYMSDDAMVTQLNGSNNNEVDMIVSAVNDVVRTAESNIIGHSSVYLNGIKSQVRSEETNLGDLTADANLWYAKQADPSVVMSLKNGGGIRADIGYSEIPAGATSASDVRYYPTQAYPAANKTAGDISQYDLQSALAFNNALAVIDVTATELKALIEHGVSEVDPNDATGYGGGKFPQIAGMTFEFDATLDAGVRVQTLAIDTNGDGNYDETVVSNGNVQGNASRTFKMVTLSYLVEGGDGYPFTCTMVDESCSNVTYLEGNMGGMDPSLANFATEGTEQDAFAEYLLSNYPDADNAYDIKDTIEDVSATDQRIIRKDIM